MKKTRVTNEKKRICNVICDVTSGGVESVLINYFSHMDCSNYILDLITYDIKSDICATQLKKLGFNIITVSPKKSGFLKSVKEMDKVIKEGNYDVVHAHLTEWNCIPMFMAWRAGVKIRISHSHMADSPKGLKNKILFAFQKVLNKIFATKFCACGDDAGKYLYGERVFNKGKVIVLNNAIDVNKFKPDKEVRESVRKELGLNDNTFCVGHIGRFLAQKNHDFLIDIFYEILKKRNNSFLILLGTGELEESIKRKTQNLEISDKVLFLGLRSDPERIYQAMDVFCLPSLFEGLPVVCIEAQAAQLPCVVSDSISKKVKITDNISFCSLQNNAATWADMLCKKTSVNCEFPQEYNINYMASRWVELFD